LHPYAQIHISLLLHLIPSVLLPSPPPGTLQVWFLIISIKFLNDRYSLWIGINAVLIILGVVIAIIEPAFEGQEVKPTIGYLYLLLGGFGYVGSLYITKLFLNKIPLGIYSLFRVMLGTLFYHILAYIQGGKKGVGSIWSGELWAQMVWYGLLFVLLGQYLW